jgi:hypothetical protein
MMPKNIDLQITDLTFRNRRAKFQKAIGELAKTLDIQVGIYKAQPKKQHAVEPYFYPIQEELSQRWVKHFEKITRAIYDTIIQALDLPKIEVETMRKAIGDKGILRYKGRVIYSPETGQPIQKKEFDALIAAIEKFLNKQMGGAGEKLVIDSAAIGKMLKRMAKYHSSADMEKLTLDTLKYKGKTFNWITDSVKRLDDVLGQELKEREQRMYQATQDWAAAKVVQVTNETRDKIKTILLNGVKEHKSKGQVSQDLFNTLGGLNRDWKRIADTEMVNASNLASIMETVNKAPEGEKVYFKRYELPGCCDKCAKVNDKIVLWSNTSLASEKIKDKNADVAIWEGKGAGDGFLLPGTLHPNCRGGWTPWNPDGIDMDAMMARIAGKAARYGIGR